MFVVAETLFHGIVDDLLRPAPQGNGIDGGILWCLMAALISGSNGEAAVNMYRALDLEVPHAAIAAFFEVDNPDLPSTERRIEMLRNWLNDIEKGISWFVDRKKRSGSCDDSIVTG
jgi:hypothetical protein